MTLTAGNTAGKTGKSTSLNFGADEEQPDTDISDANSHPDATSAKCWLDREKIQISHDDFDRLYASNSYTLLSLDDGHIKSGFEWGGNLYAILSADAYLPGRPEETRIAEAVRIVPAENYQGETTTWDTNLLRSNSVEGVVVRWEDHEQDSDWVMTGSVIGFHTPDLETADTDGQSSPIMSQDIKSDGSEEAQPKTIPAVSEVPSAVSRDIPIEKIQPSPYNPRKHFDEDAIKVLAENIRKVGLLQPIVVRKIDVPHHQPTGTTYSHYYEIVGGERRFRACVLLKLPSISCRIHVMTDEDAQEAALIENLQRQDLSPLEEAEGLSRMLARSNMTQSRLADKLGMTQDRISRRIGLLRLPKTVQEMIESKQLSASHGERLQTWSDQPAVCIAIARRAAAEGWTTSRIDGKGGPEVAAIIAEVTGVRSFDMDLGEGDRDEDGDGSDDSADAEMANGQTSIYDLPEASEPLGVTGIPQTSQQATHPEERRSEHSEHSEHSELVQDLTQELGSLSDWLTWCSTAGLPGTAAHWGKVRGDVDSPAWIAFTSGVDPLKYAKQRGYPTSQPLPDPEAVVVPEIVTTPAPVANAEPTLEGAPSGAVQSSQSAQTPKTEPPTSAVASTPASTLPASAPNTESRSEPQTETEAQSTSKPAQKTDSVPEPVTEPLQTEPEQEVVTAPVGLRLATTILESDDQWLYDNGFFNKGNALDNAIAELRDFRLSDRAKQSLIRLTPKDMTYREYLEMVLTARENESENGIDGE